MLKHALLASAMFVSAPVFAQNAPDQPDASVTQPARPESADSAEPATPAEPAAPATPAEPGTSGESPTGSAEPVAPAQPDGDDKPDQTAQAPSAPAQQSQPATAAQIATIVDQGFPTYDKDADGNLKTEEFGAWMVALRSATEPAFTGQSEADKAWIGKALAQADTDKSGSVNKGELKMFLAPQAAS